MSAFLNADLSFLLPFALVLLLTGAAAGLLAGLLGVGGGIVIVPVLYLLFPWLGVDESVRMHLAVGTSLATILPTSIMSARSHHKRGSLDWSLLKSVAPGIVLGVVGGSLLAAHVQGQILTGIFGVVAILVSLQMAFRKNEWHVAPELPGLLPRQGLGFITGSISVIMGIGGGTLSVPLFTAFSVPIRRAVGTAAAIGFLIALPGSLAFIASGLDDPALPPLSLGYTSIPGFLLIIPATMVMAPRGAALAHRISPDLLRRLFALFLFLTALRMGYDILS